MVLRNQIFDLIFDYIKAWHFVKKADFFAFSRSSLPTPFEKNKIKNVNGVWKKIRENAILKIKSNMVAF